MAPMIPAMTRDCSNQEALSHSTAYYAPSMQIGENANPPRDTTSPSPARACTTQKVESGRFPIPQIQGVVPGIRCVRRPTSSSHSLAHSVLSPHPITGDDAVSNGSASVEDSTTGLSSKKMDAMQIAHPTTSRQSNYPRPSPPIFLYPVPIVPRTFPPAQITTAGTKHNHCAACPKKPQQNELVQSSTLEMQRSDAQLAAVLPTSLKVVFLITLAAIVLGVIWSVTVCCITFPPGTWRIFGAGKGQGCSNAKNKGNNVNERTKRTKPQQQDEIEMQAFDTRSSSHNAESTNIEKSSGSPPHQSHRRYTHTSQDTLPSNPFSPRSPLSAFSSPYNPFLDPPSGQTQGPSRAYRVRSSSEWKAEHAAFFNGTVESSTPSTTVASTNKKQHVAGVEALEAGGVASVAASSGDEKEDGDEEKGVSKGVKWVDQRVGMLDDAVDGVVARMARWTDDKKLD